MNMLLLALSLCPALGQPDYAALAPALVRAAAVTMHGEPAPDMPVAIHMGSFVSALKTGTGAELDVSSLARAFAAAGRPAANRASMLDCDEAPCRWTADEGLFVRIDGMTEAGSGLKVKVHITARGGHPVGYVVNVVEYEFAWDEGWVLIHERPMARS